MLKVAIEEGVWAGFHPSTDAEWQMVRFIHTFLFRVSSRIAIACNRLLDEKF